MRAARGTCGVLSNVDRAELHPERVDEQQPAGERLADSDDQLDRFRRLNRPHQTRQHAQHAALGTARHQAGRRRFGEEAAIAGSVGQGEDRRLSLEAKDAAVHIGLAQQDAGVIDEIRRREVVGAIDDDVVPTEDVERVLRGQRRLVGLEPHVRIHIGDPLTR